jgi:transcriptional regulator with XRE-family HTH domain
MPKPRAVVRYGSTKIQRSEFFTVDARADVHDARYVSDFGPYLRRLRRVRGLTQDELAERSGLSADTVRRLEHDTFSPSLDTLIKLCEGLSLSLSTLFLAFELDEREDAREIRDLLGSRSPRDYRLAHRMLRALFNELDGEASDDGSEPSDDGSEPSGQPSDE